MVLGDCFSFTLLNNRFCVGYSVFTSYCVDLSAVRLLNPGLADSSYKRQAVESVVLVEGQSNITIGLEVVGDVPRYSIVCTK